MASLIAPLNILKNHFALRLGHIYEEKREAGLEHREAMEQEKIAVEQAEADWNEIQPRFSELTESPEKAAEVYGLVFDFMDDFNPYNTKAANFRVQYKYFGQYAPRLYAGNVKTNGEYFIQIICEPFGIDPETLSRQQKKVMRQGYQLHVGQETGVEINADGALGALSAMPIVGHVQRYTGPLPFGKGVKLEGNRNDPASLKGVNFKKVNENRELAREYAENSAIEQAEKINTFWLKAKESGDKPAMRICETNLAHFGYLPGENGPQPDPDFEKRIKEAEEQRKNDR